MYETNACHVDCTARYSRAPVVYASSDSRIVPLLSRLGVGMSSLIAAAVRRGNKVTCITHQYTPVFGLTPRTAFRAGSVAVTQQDACSTALAQ